MSVSNEKTATILPAARIQQAFARAHEEGRVALIPYFMAGFPNASQSVELVIAAAEGGADAIELGIPFSDPLADGPTVQHAGQIALNGGMSVKGCLEIAQQIAARSSVPLVLMGYYNPLLAYGLERFCKDASASGICGLIVPDLPSEEAEPLHASARRHGLSLIFLVPPTTPDQRIASIVELMDSETSSFLYCVSLSGVTGARKELPPQLRNFIARVRTHTSGKAIPLAIGFGISAPEHIEQVGTLAEGAVVGSALVDLIDQHEEHEQVEAVRQYIQRLRQK